MPPSGVKLDVADDYVIIDNGILQLELSKPGGIVTGIRYGGIDNLLDVAETNRGYWDLNWGVPGDSHTGGFDVIKGTKFEVIVQTTKQVELSFTRMWDPSLGMVPLSVDKRFVVLQGSPGFYTYAIYDHSKDWPAFSISQTRVAFKLRKDKFRYMAMAENRQRFMPTADDRKPPRGETLAYKEAVLLVDPVEPEFKGEVDDKYQYSCENKDNKVHGWVSLDPPVGFWQITPSDEFRTGGPLKQNLTSHVGPTTLAMFHSGHYGGPSFAPVFGPNEAWKKVFGPIYIYLNSHSDHNVEPKSLWEDAKKRMKVEVEGWPYNFPAAEDFPSSDKRGNISGRLFVQDGYISKEHILAASAYVGLAAPGDAGSWQTECKDYQFWTRADSAGNFSIRDVRPGNYNLYAWVPGFIGDYKLEAPISITPGSDISLGSLVYKPPRDGPTLWEIGIPDRSAAEFYVPDPDPRYINKLYVGHPDRFRQYGLWDRYTELYTDGDLVYRVGVSDYKKDWFFAHVPRKVGEEKYVGTTWQIKFNLERVQQVVEGEAGGAAYKLRVAIASATFAEVQMRVNDPDIHHPPLFTTGGIGRENTIARHGIHGFYRLYSVDVPAELLVEGENTIFLTQPRVDLAFGGILYDYIRLEAPPSSSSPNSEY